jgi:hypothetical protein
MLIEISGLTVEIMIEEVVAGLWLIRGQRTTTGASGAFRKRSALPQSDSDKQRADWVAILPGII